VPVWDKRKRNRGTTDSWRSNLSLLVLEFHDMEFDPASFVTHLIVGGEISGSHSNECEDDCLLGRCDVSSDRNLPTFQMYL
jgi:hypothetical protein